MTQYSSSDSSLVAAVPSKRIPFQAPFKLWSMANSLGSALVK